MVIKLLVKTTEINGIVYISPFIYGQKDVSIKNISNGLKEIENLIGNSNSIVDKSGNFVYFPIINFQSNKISPSTNNIIENSRWLDYEEFNELTTNKGDIRLLYDFSSIIKPTFKLFAFNLSSRKYCNNIYYQKTCTKVNCEHPHSLPGYCLPGLSS